VEDDAGHESTRKNREAMYAFFQKHLDNPGSNTDQEVEVLDEAELWVTETGKVAAIPSAETLFSLNQKWVSKQVKNLDDQRISTPQTDQLRAEVKERTGFNYPARFGPAVFSGRFQEQGYNFEKYLVSGGGDYQLPVGVYLPAGSGNQKLILLLDDQGMAEAAHRETLIGKLVGEGYTVAIADLPGIGSLGPGYLKGDAYIDNTSFNQWFAGILTGKSIVAMRAEDILRLVKFLSSDLPNIQSVFSISRGALASELLHAALFESDIKKVGLINPFLSYAALALSPDYKPAFITSVVAGAINAYDLPDLMTAVNPRNLLIVNPVNAMGQEYPDDEPARLLKYPMDQHQNFSMVNSQSEDQQIEQILSWLAN
jgi:hypothetical protein